VEPQRRQPLRRARPVNRTGIDGGFEPTKRLEQASAEEVSTASRVACRTGPQTATRQRLVGTGTNLMIVCHKGRVGGTYQG